MKVLITGANGQVGYELLRLAPDGLQLFGLDSSALDITNATAVADVFDRIKPDAVINAAAYTAVDKAEAEPERAYAVNQLGIAQLGQAAERASVPVFHLSTDYVFAGDSNEPYCPDSVCAPTGVYGASKLAGEQALALACTRYLIVRTSWVFGTHGNNFVKTMLRLGHARDAVSVVADQQGGPTSAAGIARMLWHLVDQYRAQGTLPWGIYHYSGAPACTWHEFAVEVFEQGRAAGLLARSPRVHAITTDQYPTPARRPSWSVLDCSALQQVFGISQDDWRQALSAVMYEMANEREQQE